MVGGWWGDRTVKSRLLKVQVSESHLALSGCQFFTNNNLFVNTKITVHNAVIASILLYGTETWTLKTPDVCKLTVFHNRVLQSWSRFRQWNEHIISQFGRLLITFWCKDCGG